MEQSNNISLEATHKGLLSEYPDVLNLEQMSQILGISTKTGGKLLQGGTIKSFRVGRSYRVLKPYLISYMTSAPSN